MINFLRVGYVLMAFGTIYKRIGGGAISELNNISG